MQQQQTLSHTFAQFILNHRWWVIAATLIAIFLAASGGKNLTFNPDNRAFFAEGNPQLVAFEHMENTYSGRDETVLIVFGPQNGDVFTNENLAVIEKYTEEAWQLPYSTRVDSIANYQHSYAQDDDLIIEDLVQNASQLNSENIANIKEIALSEPLLVKRVVSEKGHVAAINVTIKKPGKDISEEAQLVQAAREMADRIRAESPGADVHLTGLIMLNNAFSEASANDSKTLMPLTLLIFLVAIAFLLKSWSSPFATLCIILFSILGSMGIAGWIGIELTAVSASAPTIIITLAIANAVHVLVSFKSSMRQGMTKYDAMAESIRINLQPITLVSLTTTLGFLTMNMSDSPPFHALGNIVAMGVMISFVLCLTFLPALIMVLPGSKVKESSEEKSPMFKLAEFVISHQNKLLAGIGAIFVILLSFLPANDLNDEWIKYFAKSVDFRQATDYTTENLTGIYQIDYSLSTNQKDGISSPDFLNKVQDFTEWYREQPEVIQVTSIPEIIIRLNKNLHGDDAAYKIIPSDKDLTAQYLLLYEMSLPYGLDLNNRIDMEKSATRVTVTTKDITTRETLALEARAQSWLEQNAPDYQAPGTGNSIMFAHIGMRNIIGTLTGAGFALILISLVLMFAFRSFKIGLISLLPNLMPAAMGFGLWGILVGEIGMGLATVAGVTMGIVVDDSVHFLSKYLRARREKQLSSEDAVRYAFSTVGTALWFTSMVLVAGFTVLGFSTFKMNGDMATLTAVTVALALLADFLFLPPLLIKVERLFSKSKAKDSTAKATQFDTLATTPTTSS